MVKKTGNKWSTDKCGHCGKGHYQVAGRFTARNIEYVICGRTHKRIYLADAETAPGFYPDGVWNKEQKYLDYVQDQFAQLTKHDHKLLDDVVEGLVEMGWHANGVGKTSVRLSKDDSAIKVFRAVERPDMIQIRFTAPPEEE